MRDQHKSKRDLIVEVTALRKQVADLKEEASARHRVEAALRESLEQYRTCVAMAPFGIVELSPDGEIVGANPAMAELLGYDSPSEMASPEHRANLFAGAQERARVLASLGEENRSVPITTHCRDKRGGLVGIELAGCTMHNHGGAVSGFVAYAMSLEPRPATSGGDA